MAIFVILFRICSALLLENTQNIGFLFAKLVKALASAYLRHVNFHRRPFLAKFLIGHVWTVPGNMLVKFELEVRSFNRFGAISIV